MIDFLHSLVKVFVLQPAASGRSRQAVPLRFGIHQIHAGVRLRKSVTPVRPGCAAPG